MLEFDGKRVSIAAVGTAAAVGVGYAVLRSASTQPPKVPLPEELPRNGSMFVFGLGFTGLRVAAVLARHGWTVTGTVRTSAAARRLSAAHRNLRTLVFDSAADDSANDIDEIVAAVATSSYILVTAAPTAAGDPILAHPTLARAISEAKSNGHVVWVGYLSTVGVYGDHGGAEVTEDTPVDPRSERGRRRVVRVFFQCHVNHCLFFGVRSPSASVHPLL